MGDLGGDPGRYLIATPSSQFNTLNYWYSSRLVFLKTFTAQLAPIYGNLESKS
jgi:hypothetical protein